MSGKSLSSALSGSRADGVNLGRLESRSWFYIVRSASSENAADEGSRDERCDSTEADAGGPTEDRQGGGFEHGNDHEVCDAYSPDQQREGTESEEHAVRDNTSDGEITMPSSNPSPDSTTAPATTASASD